MQLTGDKLKFKHSCKQAPLLKPEVTCRLGHPLKLSTKLPDHYTDKFRLACDHCFEQYVSRNDGIERTRHATISGARNGSVVEGGYWRCDQKCHFDLCQACHRKESIRIESQILKLRCKLYLNKFARETSIKKVQISTPTDVEQRSPDKSYVNHKLGGLSRCIYADRQQFRLNRLGGNIMSPKFLLT